MEFKWDFRFSRLLLAHSLYLHTFTWWWIRPPELKKVILFIFKWFANFGRVLFYFFFSHPSSVTISHNTYWFGSVNTLNTTICNVFILIYFTLQQPKKKKKHKISLTNHHRLHVFNSGRSYRSFWMSISFVLFCFISFLSSRFFSFLIFLPILECYFFLFCSAISTKLKTI